MFQSVHLLRIILFFIIASLSTVDLHAQSSKQRACTVMKTGTFKYLEAEDPTAYFVITDTSHTEFYADGKFHIKSTIKWTSPCQYSLEMYENTMPDFPFKVGDKLFVTINTVRKDIIYYSSEINGQKWEASVRKIPSQ